MRIFILLCLLFISSNAAANRQCIEFFHSNIVIQSPQFRQAQLGKVDVTELQQYPKVRIATWNIFNFYDLLGKAVWTKEKGTMKVADARPKDPELVSKSIHMYERLDADILFLQEIESVRNAKRFNKNILNNAYKDIIFETNDGRGIRVGIFIKKSLAKFFNFETISYVNETWRDPTKNGEINPLFSRNLGVVLMRTKDRSQDDPPNLVLIVTHLKSKRDRANDKESDILRGAQVQRTVEIINALREKWGQDLRIIEAGDHNGVFNKNQENYDPEFGPFQQANIVSISNLPSINKNTQDPRPSMQKWHTQSYHPRGKENVYSEFDGILISNNLVSSYRTGQALPFKDDRGNIMYNMPRSYEERSQQSSDHRPVLGIFETNLLFGMEP